MVFQGLEYSLSLNEFIPYDFTLAIEANIENMTTQGWDESKYYETMIDMVNNGDYVWSKRLTLVVMNVMGIGRVNLRKRYPTMSNDDFEMAWQAKVDHVHNQIYNYFPPIEWYSKHNAPRRSLRLMRIKF